MQKSIAWLLMVIFALCPFISLYLENKLSSGIDLCGLKITCLIPEVVPPLDQDHYKYTLI